MLHQVLPIQALRNGETGTIVAVHGQEASKSRLAEMGLREGKTVKMIREGKPCLLAVDNHRFSIRSKDLDDIFVEVSFA